MTELERYILEEWAEDYQDGHVSRREFLRRIVVFSGGAAAAVSVARDLGVAASSEEIAAAASTNTPLRAQAGGVTVPPDDPTIVVERVAFNLGAAPVFGYLARPKSQTNGPVPGMIVVHENRGLLEHHKDVARRLAKAGYAALAVDLASPGGGTDKFSDLAEVTALLGRTPPTQLVAMLDEGVRYLQGLHGVRPDRIGTVGFCFGGGMVWRLATKNADLRAAVPFYGPNPPLDDVPKIRAAVLALYGGLDQRIDAGIPAIRDALQQAGVTYEIHVYDGANHAFFNDTGPNYQPDAAKDAWTRTLAWLARWLSAT